MIGLARTFAILLAIALGLLLPQAHVLAPAIRWIVMAMLLIVFLETRLTRAAVSKSHVALLAANVGLAFLAWGLGWLAGGRDVALAAFFAGIAPTAVAAPVIMRFLQGRVEWVVAASLLSNIVIAALLPVLLPLVLGRATPEAFAQVLGSVGLVVFVPLVVAGLLRRVYPAAAHWPARLSQVSFGLWIATMFLVTANASEFVRAQADTPARLLLEVAGASLVVCAANFATGALIGGRELRREASQSLGQKNTSFTIYLALAYAGPVVALGPTCYVVWHNLWNSWQLHRAQRGVTPP